MDWTYGYAPNSLAEFRQEADEFAIFNAHVYQNTTYFWRQFPNPAMYLKYSTVPFDYIQNTFDGVALRELLQYTVFEVYKPWQAQEVSNYVVFKIPPKPDELGKKILEFNFNSSSDIWSLISNAGPYALKYRYNDKDGRLNKGSLEILAGGGRIFPSRLMSSPIKISAGKMYTVKGWIKNYPIVDGEPTAKDGFLRLDFYKSNNKKDFLQVSEAVAISERAIVNGEWVQVEANVVAPKQAKYAVISFQAKDPGSPNSMLDDVELYESNRQFPVKYREIPYIKSTIPNESLYFNSFL